MTAKTSQIKAIALLEKRFQGNGVVKVDANGLTFRQLNSILKNLDNVSHSEVRVKIENVYGQRYIGAGLKNPILIDIHGVSGNDLGFLLDNQRIRVWGNVQDGCGNTMNKGEIIVHGSAGDILGYSMRGGRIFVKGNAGYRMGIHMKEYRSTRPAIIIGGIPGDFLGEYMAGGVIVALGLNQNQIEWKPKFVGVGMHGGIIFLPYKPRIVGENVNITSIETKEEPILSKLIMDFCDYFKHVPVKLLSERFYKLTPRTYRPYGEVYSY